jgi:hypothetical protein
MRLWYLRRAIPWRAVAGCAAVAAVLVVLACRWSSLASLSVPLGILLLVSAACFAFDEPAVAVTAVTPRSSRWAMASRCGACAALLVAGLVLLAATPGSVVGDLARVLFASGAVALAAVLVGVRREVARPGAVVATAVVLGGLAPLVVGPFFDWPSPYPPPALGDGLRAAWGVAAAVGLITVVAGVRGRPR